MQRSITKRIRITKNGKVVRRRMGVDHFRAKKSSKARIKTRKSLGLNYPLTKLDFTYDKS